jgi:hypothetical protein
LFIVEDLGVGDAGAVVERGVDEAVADCRALHRRRPATAVYPPPAAAGRDAGDLLDVDVDHLTGSITLIATWRLGVRRSVTAVEPTETFTTQDRLHRRRRQSELVTNVGGTPPMPMA